MFLGPFYSRKPIFVQKLRILAENEDTPEKDVKNGSKTLRFSSRAKKNFCDLKFWLLTSTRKGNQQKKYWPNRRGSWEGVVLLK